MKLSLLAIPLLILAGCSSTPEVPKMKMAMGVPDGTVEYKAVPTTNLHLDLLSSPDLYAGQKTELVFALSNNGRKTISIPEITMQTCGRTFASNHFIFFMAAHSFEYIRYYYCAYRLQPEHSLPNPEKA